MEAESSQAVKTLMSHVALGMYLRACAEHDTVTAHKWLAAYRQNRPVSEHERVCLATPTVHAVRA
jgi:hypothetical protein